MENNFTFEWDALLGIALAVCVTIALVIKFVFNKNTIIIKNSQLDNTNIQNVKNSNNE